MTHRKIIRDKKPSLPGWQKSWQSKIAQDALERNMYLLLKIDEEVAELCQVHKIGDRQKILEEFCDIYEIILSLDENREDFCRCREGIQDIIDGYSITLTQIQEVADRKRSTHGGFTEGILLDLDTVVE